MTDFSKPFAVDDNPFGKFGSSFYSMVPDLKDIPKEFEGRREWSIWAREWFFKGLREYPKPKEGVDLKMAMKHLAAIQRSWEPKHEDKEVYVAYLASLWFDPTPTTLKG